MMLKIRHLAPIVLGTLAGAALAAQSTAKPGPEAQARQATAPVDKKADPAYRTRDWAAIDTNKDNLISPEEMEAYLAANPGPLRTASTK